MILFHFLLLLFDFLFKFKENILSCHEDQGDYDHHFLILFLFIKRTSATIESKLSCDEHHLTLAGYLMRSQKIIFSILLP